MRNSLFALVAVFVCFGCPSPQHCDVKFAPNESFTLNHGATACLKNGDFTIQFVEVSGDSRCPTGVQCIWAGRADVVLSLATGVETQAVKTQTVTLASGDMSQGGAGEATFEGYTVRLENVEPYPQEGKVIEQKDYQVKLVVAK
jgi:hypothetical protein